MYPTLSENKKLPYSIEAEQMLLACILIDEFAFTQIIHIIKECHFYHLQHQVIFSKIEEIYKKGLKIDAITVHAKLEKDNQLEFVGGYKYLNDLIDAIVNSTKVVDYALIVKEMYSLRELITSADKLKNLCFNSNNKSINDIITIHYKYLMTISYDEDEKVFDFDSVSNTLDSKTDNIIFNNYDNVQHKFNQLFSADYITSTGIQQIHSLRKQHLVFIGGKPGMGKTTLAIQMLLDLTPKHNCLFFSLEMSGQEIFNKARANLGNEFTKERCNFKIIKEHNLNIQQIEQHIIQQSVKQSKIVDVIFIDHLGLMHRERNEIEYQALMRYTRELKLLAGKHNILIICLAQLNRSDRDRLDKRPELTDLKGSSSIEQDADAIMFVYREDYGTKNEHLNQACKNKIEIILEKFRHGKPQSLLMNVDFMRNKVYAMSEIDKYKYTQAIKSKKQDND